MKKQQELLQVIDVLNSEQQEVLKRAFSKENIEIIKKYGRRILEELMFVSVEEISPLFQELKSKNENLKGMELSSNQELQKEKVLERFVYIRNGRVSMGEYSKFKELPLEVYREIEKALSQEVSKKEQERILEGEIKGNGALLKRMQDLFLYDVVFIKERELEPEEKQERQELKREIQRELKEILKAEGHESSVEKEEVQKEKVEAPAEEKKEPSPKKELSSDNRLFKEISLYRAINLVSFEQAKEEVLARQDNPKKERVIKVRHNELPVA